MDLTYTPEEEDFRAGLRTWLGEVLPRLPEKPAAADWPGRRAYDTAWQRMLYDAGYAGLHWPRDAGGQGATATQHLIFLEETERAGAPYVGANFVGLLHAGPTLAVEGSAAQRARWLPPILRGEETWCQGFSEPDAGLTSPRCGPGPYATGTAMSSAAPRSGPRTPRSPTGANSWSAPTRPRPGITASAGWRCPWTHRA